MRRFTRITAAYRFGDTGIRLVFDRDEGWNFEMQRGDPFICIGETQSRGKMYQAPFDVLLAKRFNRSTIRSVTLHNDDKIIRIEVSQEGSYKSETTLLQFEFTGKHTNVIILDRDEVVLEALRHIDEAVSSRPVRVGQALLNPPPPSFVPQEYPLEDVRAYLVEECRHRSGERLDRLKKEKTVVLSKRLKHLADRLGELENEAALESESNKAQHQGYLILAHLESIKPYDTAVAVDDFDGTPVRIDLPAGVASPARYADWFFKRSRKLRQKAQGLHLERHNLEEKIRHLKLFIHTVESARSPEEIGLLFPPKNVTAKTKGSDSIAEFWIEGVKVSLGKSEKGNIELLRSAKAKDIWMHLKDRPSAHVVISTDKQQLPEKLLEAAAKLCVDFSVFEKGRYLVDYTPRREVRVQEGANVLYTNYKTLSIEKG